MSDSTAPATQLRGARFWLGATAVATVMGLLSFVYHYTDVYARGYTEPVHIKLIEEMTGTYSLLVVLPVIVWLTRRLRGWPWTRSVPVHIVAAVGLSIVETSWNWGTRILLFRVLGYGWYDYGIMRLRYLMELPNYVVWYAVIVCLLLLADHYAAARARDIRVAKMEGELARLRLQSLEAQLQPHFLFNALNTISAVMYEDVAAADAIITRLGDLLRRTLQRQGVAEVSLAEEVETLQLYCDILRARFAERLEMTIAVDAGASMAMVPQLVLQPLVENAIKHGDPGPGRRARIAVRAHRENGSLLVEVEDNGPGLSRGNGGGIGLQNTRRRLEQLYGDRQSLELGAGADGGLRVVITVPYHAAPDHAVPDHAVPDHAAPASAGT